MRASFFSFTALAVLIATLNLDVSPVSADGTLRKTSLFLDIPGLPSLPDANSTQVAVRDSGLDLDNIQHDVLVGMIKNVELFYFFGIADATTFKSVLASDIRPNITSVSQVLSVDTQPTTAVNIAFSASGLTTLGIDPTTLNDDIFTSGQWADISNLGDPGTSWVDAFAGTTMHGLLILQSDTDDNINNQLAAIQSALGDSITELYSLNGAARPDDQAGHEHFGFLDGISQPAVVGYNDGSALPGQVSVDAGHFLLSETGDSVTRPDWSKDSSFLAFRQLQQLVPEFNNYLLTNALTGDDLTQQGGADLLGARMMGRWKSGAPIDLAPTADDPDLAADSQRNNNFDFTHSNDTSFDISTNETYCPWSAHIRKTNPRADFGTQNTVNRILRAGIPYGPEVTDAESTSGVSDSANERGLAFVSYQSSYSDGFHFLQQTWANNPNFFPGRSPAPGYDPIIGADDSNPRNSTALNPDDFSQVYTLQQDFVVSRGGEYFLTPSLTAIDFIASN